MPFIGEGPELRSDVMPAWASLPPYNPAGVYVAQWPVQQTQRVDGRYRINSDSLQRAISLRWLARLKLVHYPFFPALNDPEVRYLWYWFDLSVVSGQTFTFTGGAAVDGTTISGTAQYLPDLGLGLGSGFLWTLDTDTQKDPPSTRTLRLPDGGVRMQYNKILPSVTQLPESDPPQDDPVYGPFYQAVDIDAWPLSECFPIDEWQISPEVPAVPGSIVALFSKTIAQQITVGGGSQPVSWQTKNFGNSQWWDAGSDPTKILVPEGINWLRFAGNARFGQAGGGVNLFLWKNGATFPGDPFSIAEFTASEILNISSGWLPTLPADEWQLMVAVTVTRDLQASDWTWLSVEGTS